MKKVILKFVQKTHNLKELVQEALNQNFLNFLISAETINFFKNLKHVILYSKSPEDFSEYVLFDSKTALQKYNEKHPLKKRGFYKILNSKEDEIEIQTLIKEENLDFIVVFATDWKIIPFENLISFSQSSNVELIAHVDDIKDAELLLKTLETGVNGIMFTPKKVRDLIKLKKFLNTSFKIELKLAKVLKIQNFPESDRVCVDTTSLLKRGEGMLIGSTAQGFVLVHSETIDTKFVSSRPFRVNAGDVSAYILVPGDDTKIFKTKYLSEIKGGDKVLVVNTDGIGRIVSVGRVKIETRPMLRFELETKINSKKISISCVCQNAETIRLVDSNGDAISVVDIKVGDEILVHLGPGATHFGTKIKETIIEK
ncbi:MAG: 3-dehydroquinate synthase II [Candidatus Heimdallarchaeota archaeon]